MISDLIIVDFDLCLLAGDKFFWSNDTGTVNWILGLDRIFIFHSVCPLFSAFLAVRTKEFWLFKAAKKAIAVFTRKRLGNADDGTRNRVLWPLS